MQYKFTLRVFSALILSILFSIPVQAEEIRSHLASYSGTIKESQVVSYPIYLNKDEAFLLDASFTSGLTTECRIDIKVELLDSSSNVKGFKRFYEVNPEGLPTLGSMLQFKAEESGNSYIKISRRNTVFSSGPCQDAAVIYNLDITKYTGYLSPSKRTSATTGLYSDMLIYSEAHDYFFLLPAEKALNAKLVISNNSGDFCPEKVNLILKNNYGVVVNEAYSLGTEANEKKHLLSLDFESRNTSAYSLTVERGFNSSQHNSKCFLSDYEYLLDLTIPEARSCNTKDIRRNCKKKAKKRCRNRSNQKQCKKQVKKRCIKKKKGRCGL